MMMSVANYGERLFNLAMKLEAMSKRYVGIKYVFFSLHILMIRINKFCSAGVCIKFC